MSVEVQLLEIGKQKFLSFTYYESVLRQFGRAGVRETAQCA